MPSYTQESFFEIFGRPEITGRSTVDNFYRGLKSYLEFETEVVGNLPIEVNEDFTLKITVSNTAEAETPWISFDNPRVSVQGTYYAQSKEGGSVDRAFPDTKLGPGESSEIEVPMHAEHAINPANGAYQEELVATVLLWANFSFGPYSYINKIGSVLHNIEPVY
jgi:hypothetical protein